MPRKVASATATVSTDGWSGPTRQPRRRTSSVTVCLASASPSGSPAETGVMACCAAPSTLCTGSSGESTAASTSRTAETESPPTSISPRISRSLRVCVSS